MLRIAHSKEYSHNLPEGHRFPMIKYDLLPEQLVYEGTVSTQNFFAPDPISEELILLTHDADYWYKLKNLLLSKSEIRKTGFPLSEKLVLREQVICQGTVQTIEYALAHGVSLNIAGGTHHAFTDRGEGFCLLNDIAIAANYLLHKQGFERILIVDLDVHQGNGTAQIFEQETRVFTFSMHGAKNYPMHKEKSDLDIPLPDGIGDKQYLELLNRHLSQLIDQFEPQFIFFQSGVDVLHTDKLGRLGMTIAGCKERDRTVFELCKRNKVPVAVSMGGGYSARIANIVEAHANTFRLAQELYF
ncbi:histone deacetylase [Flammeovirgaceae bacterium SG7u.111]|nr:histone deacetylase [Flammeovirgaceae bacterium SG7u.132]WPO34881.1 histone deacetylase [Flammeovirgaceae bacterium SG7u.111]